MLLGGEVAVKGKLARARQRLSNGNEKAQETINSIERTSEEMWQEHKQIMERYYNRYIALPGQGDGVNDGSGLNSQDDIEGLADKNFGFRMGKAEVIEWDKIPSYKERLRVSRAEVEFATRRLRNRMFTSPEGLKFKTLLIAIKYQPELFTQWATMCFWVAYVPKQCRTTTGKIIPKATKGKFRIVHVGSPMSAILEQIALARLEHHLENNGGHNVNQFGFVASRGRHELVARVVELTTKHRLIMGKQKSCTTIIGLDVKGAFDNVNQELLKNKIMNEMAPDSLRYWLHNFIHNRSIIIKYKNLTAKSRFVRKGVPQGSCLGPILWNYVINKIDENVTETGIFEVLAYADDIIIVYNGTDWSYMQYKLDLLISKLGQLDLEVEPEKCMFMRIMLKCPKRFKRIMEDDAPDITIYDKEIPKTDIMSILGVPITDDLELKSSHERYGIRIKKSTQMLCLTKRLNIIYSHKEWRILMDSYINSHVFENNFVMLAIDLKARNWANKLIARAAKRIFDWSSKAATKTVKLLLNIQEVRPKLNKALSLKICANHHADSYSLLKLILKYGLDKLIKKADKQQLLDLPSTLTIRPLTFNTRRHADPSKSFEQNACINLSDTQIMSPRWINIACTEAGPAVCELLGPNIVLRIICGGHDQGRSANYFANMGLLWHLASSSGNKFNKRTKKFLVFETNDALLQALRNNAKHDQNIIKLREKLYDSSWDVCQVNNTNQFNEIRDMIKREIKNWISGGKQPQRVSKITELKFEWPNVEDRIEMAKIEREFDKIFEKKLAEQHTRMTKALCSDVTPWRKPNPSWIASKTIFMLQGMFRNSENKIVHGALKVGDIPDGCEDTCMITEDDMMRPNLQRQYQSLVTTHRAFMCPRFRDKRRELCIIMNKALAEKIREVHKKEEQQAAPLRPWNADGAIDMTLENRRLVQPMLRILADIAMGRDREGYALPQ